MSGEDKIRSKIKEIEEEYARTQKNKATEVCPYALRKAKIMSKERTKSCEIDDDPIIYKNVTES